MSSIDSAENTPTDPKTKPEHQIDKEYEKKPDDEVLHGEESKDATPADSDEPPHDTARDAKDRWDSESPAQKGQPNRIDPEPINEDGSVKENPDEDDELEEIDPDADKNVK